MPLQPDVSWREQYVSHALNRKLWGILPVGVYRGYAVSDAGNANVSVVLEGGKAVAENNGYSISVHGSGSPQVLAIPQGAYKIVIDVSYVVGGATTAHLRVVQEPEEGNAIVADVTNTNGALKISQRPRINLAALAEDNLSLDFGRVIDLGDVAQNFAGALVDFGEL